MHSGVTATFARRCFAFAAVALSLLFLGAYIWVQLGPALPLDEPIPLRRSLVLVTTEGDPFARIGDYRESPIVASNLPPLVIAPFLAIEDRRFLTHGGLDLRGILRATLANVSASRMQQGGSTITQQLAKIAFAGSERSFTRKVKEALIALRLERQYSKEEILSAYLNRVYFGDGVYGLHAAARHYYGKEPAELTVGEAAMLAGVINAPSRLAPTRHLVAAQRRAAVVVEAMADAGYLTRIDVGTIAPARPIPALPLLENAGYFADWVAPQIGPGLRDGYGRVEVRTTLEATLQQRAAKVVAHRLTREGSRRRAAQAALVAMRTDGSIVAMVGGRDYHRSQFNRAAQARRQPGSAFKPFVYLAALRAGADAETLIDDRPVSIQGWSPKNHGNRYEGPISLTRAFARSSNVAAVRLSETVGRDAVIRAARDFGLNGDLKPVPSLALGAYPTTLLDLTSAYAGIAAGAYPVIPTGLPPSVGPSLVSGAPEQATMSYHERAELLAMLNAAVETGTGEKARLPIPVYGKTGTTQNSRDAWFVGFAGDLIVGVWVGNDDETPMKSVTGGGLPAEIWREFMIMAVGDQIAAAEIHEAEEAARAREEQERLQPESDLSWWHRTIERLRPRQWIS